LVFVPAGTALLTVLLDPCALPLCALRHLIALRTGGIWSRCTAEEIADVIVSIASPRAYWINGRNIPVDDLEKPHAPRDRRAY
jgi:hypothetical protein